MEKKKMGRGILAAASVLALAGWLGRVWAENLPVAPFPGGALLSPGAGRFDPHGGGPLKVDYRVPSGCRVTLTVYNASGEVVRNVEDQRMAPGSYSAFWDGKDANGAWVRPGRYRIVLAGRDLFEFKEVMVA